MQTSTRQLIRVPFNINDPAFSQEVVRVFRTLHGTGRTPGRARSRK
jgi:uncharacterized protein (UPF0261 family)